MEGKKCALGFCGCHFVSVVVVVVQIPPPSSSSSCSIFVVVVVGGGCEGGDAKICLLVCSSSTTHCSRSATTSGGTGPDGGSGDSVARGKAPTGDVASSAGFSLVVDALEETGVGITTGGLALVGVVAIAAAASGCCCCCCCFSNDVTDAPQNGHSLDLSAHP